MIYNYFITKPLPQPTGINGLALPKKWITEAVCCIKAHWQMPRYG